MYITSVVQNFKSLNLKHHKTFNNLTYNLYNNFEDSGFCEFPLGALPLQISKIWTKSLIG